MQAETVTETRSFEVAECTDARSWNEALCSLPGAHPLQSWHWGEAKERLGESAVRLAVTGGGRVLAMAQAFRRKLAPGLYAAWIPKGPAWVPHLGTCGGAVASALKLALRRRGFRILIARPYDNDGHLPLGMRVPRQSGGETFWLDLGRPDEDLERGAERTWKKNRDRFFRIGGNVVETEGDDAPAAVVDLVERAALRKGFARNGEGRLIRAVWTAFRTNPCGAASAHVFEARFEGKCVAAMLALRLGAGVHGIWSSFDYGARKCNPNEALHWTMVRRMKACGVTRYDLEGGAARGSAENSGVSDFKRRMGGSLIALPGPVWSPLF